MTTETGTPTAVTTPVRVRPPDEMSVAVQPKNPGEMMVLAIQNNVDPEVLKKLMDLQREWEATQARKAYVLAMTAFKKECPAVLNRDATVDFTSQKGRTHYRHATLGGIVQAITPLLSANGLSVSFETSQNKDFVSVTCNITHEAGHRESTTLVGPQDTSGNKNLIQAVGSAVTYLQRYTLLSALGLATADQDDDGFSAEVAERRAQAASKAGNILASKKAAPESPATAPAAQPASDSAQDGSQEQPIPAVVAGKIEEVTRKPGGTKEKPWLRFGVKIGGTTYGTFDKTHGELAEAAHKDGDDVEIEWKQNGKYLDLVGIRLMNEPEPVDQEPKDDLPWESRDELIAKIEAKMKSLPGGPVSRALKKVNATTTDWQELGTPALADLLAELNAE